MKKVAVVILNWNGRKLLEQFLPALVADTTADDVELVVADNGSTDDSLVFLEQAYPQITRIALDQNFGFAEGYNRALKQIRAEYFVLLNSDVLVTEGWLSPLVDYMDTHADVAAVQPKILAYWNRTFFEYAGASGGFLDKYGYPFCRGRIFGDVEKDDGQYNVPCDVFWASGACMFIRSEAYFACGGLDATFFAHMEEIDLCWRILSRGHRIVCLPVSVVYHMGGATLNEENPHKTFLNFRNNLLMLFKNLSDKEFKKVFRIRRLLDFLAAVHFLLRGKSANAKAVRKAYHEFNAIKHNYISARLENHAKAVQLNIQTIYRKSILFDYYLLAKKTFSKFNF